MSERGLRLHRIAGVLREHGLLESEADPEDVEVLGVSQDSRAVVPGDLFLCWKGTAADGHDHLGEAVAEGAVAAVVERPLPEIRVPQLRVRNGRRAAAIAADAVFRSPWKDLFTVGVTGTNGKTTTALLARHLLAPSAPAAAMGTLGLVDAHGRVRRGTEGLTTPGPVQLSRWLRELVGEGVGCVALETSSHALEQFRLDGMRFDVAVFTNFSLDHLDYHGTEDAYLQAKARLLDLLSPGGTRVVNSAEPAWASLPDHPGRLIGFRVEEGEAAPVPSGAPPGPGGAAETEELVAKSLRLGPAGASFHLAHGSESEEVQLPLLGRFNVENALGAAGAALAHGRPLAEVAKGLRDAPQLPGRLEVVERGTFTIVIDFAHTPAALERVLETLRPLFPGRLIVVFGAGGDRDPSKRAPMGRAVARAADLPVVTSDNPRTEDPDRIIDDIVEGMEGRRHERIPDRREAIGRALELAREGDVVLLAGKGHERYQTVGTEKRPFDEREVVRELLGVGGGP